MKNKMFRSLFVVSLLITGMFVGLIGFDDEFVGEVSAFAGGDGSPGNPFKISNVTHLQNMSANLSAHYILINDIDASNTTTWNWNGTIYNGFNPIANDIDSGADGFQGNNFSGSLDGQGYNITGLFINRSSEDYVGLFGRINSSAVIKNVNLVNFSVYGDEEVAGLIGYNDGGTVTNCSADGNTNVPGIYNDYGYNIGGMIGHNTGTVKDCYVYGNVNGTADDTGGLIGYNEGIVINCTSYANATGDIEGGGDKGSLIGFNGGGTVINCTAYGYAFGYYDIGGLIGLNWLGTIINCTSYGNVTGGLQFGGLIGDSYGDVTNCKAYGNIIPSGIGSEWSVGGLIGSNDGPVTNCTAYGNTKSNQMVGGLIGNNGGVVTNCTVYGNTTGTYGDCWAVGGLIGYNDWVVTNCTAFGNVNGTGIFSEDVGGLIGWNEDDGMVTDCSAYGNTTGNNNTGGLMGYNEGGGTNCTSYGNTTGNINVGGLIGNNSEIVINCTSYGDTTGNWYVGGVTGYNTGTVKNCTAYGNTSSKNSDYIGGLIGYNNGTVTNSSAYGNTTGDVAIGGLIGLNLNTGTVINCTAYGNVIGLSQVGGLFGNNSGTVNKCGSTGNATGTGDYVGGLIGNNSGTVTNCFSHSNATGDDNVGGLIGNNVGGTVTNCYSIGYVTGNSNIGGLIGSSSGTVTGCFWDNETSGQTTSAGGLGVQGKNTTEMIMEITFTSEGWDFVDVWGIDNGELYPFFMFWYNPPMIITPDVEITFEDSLYIVDYDAYYSTHSPDNDIDTWKLTTNASSWLSIDANGVLSGTPTNDDFGSYWVNVTVTDLVSGNDSHNFTLTVFNVNDPPIITTLDNTTAIEDVFYSVDYDAVDIDPTMDTFTWKLATTASIWLNINGLTGVLSGTPINSDIGTFWVNITVNDGNGGTNSTNFTLKVDNTNDPPTITTTDEKMTVEDVLYSVDYEATDIDPTGDTLTWTLTSNASWLDIDETTGVLSGTPNNTHMGSYWVNVTVSDGNGGTNSTNFTITVQNVNDDPIITTTQVLDSATQDLEYYFNFSASDIDPTGDILTWNLTTDAGWLEINGSTGNLTGTPANADVGSCWVNVTVSDGNGGTNSTNFTITVQNVNDDPTIILPTIPSAMEDDLYTLDFDAVDIDPTGDTLSWSLATDADWLGDINVLGVISGTPINAHVGSYWVNVTVSDGIDGTASHNFSLEVTNVNDDPGITTSDVLNATEDVHYYVNYSAIDIDPTGDTLTWALNTKADWLKINSSTGNLTGTPTNAHIGEYWVNVTVSDGNSGVAWHNFTFTVENVNDKPDITTDNVITAKVGELYSVVYTATDIDPTNDILTWSLATNASSWLNINASTGVLSGTPTVVDVGIYWVNVTVSDGHGGRSWHNFTLTVSSDIVPNNDPEITTNNILKATVGEKYSIGYTATDDHTNVALLIWNMKTNATWLSFGSTTGILSGTPLESDLGSYWVNITVGDGEDGFAFTNFTIMVTKAVLENTEPELTDGEMTPETGDTDTEFTFSVHYSDPDGDPPEVIEVVIDGENYTMTLKPGENASNGIYEKKMKLPKGDHKYYFKASDDQAPAKPGDDNTPTSSEEAKSTPKVTEAEAKEEAADNSVTYILIIIVVIIILAILGFIMSRRKPTQGPTPHEVEEEAEEEE